MQFRNLKMLAFSIGVLLTATLFRPGSAYAVPSFARQTGMSCAACHTVFPELTPFGREFKLNGYVLTNTEQVKDASDTNKIRLALNRLPPLSAMVFASWTRTTTAQPDPDVGGNAQNGDVLLPEQFSLFYAGRIAPHLGAFTQLTYDPAAGAIGIDNIDIRYARQATLANRPLIYGLTLNNNPTVQDLWNSTPAWGFPYAASSVAPAPVAATQLDGTLGQGVAGLGAYAYFNDLIYAEVSAYRSAPQGIERPLSSTSGAANVISSAAPYWRLALQHRWSRNSFELGTYGLMADMFPGGGTPDAPVALSGSTNRYTDVAFDTQLEHIGDKHLFSVAGTLILETQDFSATSTRDSLDTMRVIGTYYFKRMIGGSVGYFSTSGTADPALYADASATSSPNSSGIIGELNYVPWLNTKFSIQYTAYTKFNGASANYDGSGRNASDNNTLYLLAWLML